LKNQVNRNKMHGIQMERKAPKIVSSLQMITSCLLEQNPNEAAAIMKVLESYQASSGQVVSPDKFEGSYNRSVPNYYEYMTCQQINIMAVTSLCRYMSPLLVFRRSKKDFFSFLKERVWKVKWWKKNSYHRWTRQH
jgi:hypothetical protein